MYIPHIITCTIQQFWSCLYSAAYLAQLVLTALALVVTTVSRLLEHFTTEYYTVYQRIHINSMQACVITILPWGCHDTSNKLAIFLLHKIKKKCVHMYLVNDTYTHFRHYFMWFSSTINLITPPCLLVTVTFRHKETLQGTNNITTVTLLQVTVNQFHITKDICCINVLQVGSSHFHFVLNNGK